VFEGSDIAGYNSNQYDIPLLAEEFIRAGVNFDFSKCRMIDAMVIFRKMERRNLAAAYKFYTGRKMEDDFQAHRADEDTEATLRVLEGQLDMYAPGMQEEEDRVLENNMDFLHEFSRQGNNVDFAGRFKWMPLTDASGKQVLDEKGNPVMKETFNFGKYKNMFVVDVLRRDPGYYSWMMQGEFPADTKQVLTRIRLKELGK
ncbi:MAG: 3'-5' exonuclease, partial [Prevotellaceae bacterium]|nr:3'-5' exonuclease [Prevotellaceae bacterium]